VPTGGGTRGGQNETAKTQAWKQYEDEYLKHVLQNKKHDTTGLDEVEKHIYLENVTSKYKQESDESLKREFELWLLGKHQANFNPGYYKNPTGEPGDGKQGAPVRRHVYRGQSVENGTWNVPGEIRDDWRSTPWGTSSLLHLPGVRDYFRKQYERGQADDLQMQLLAEHGPQDIASAWKYFKHWVKQRPMSDAHVLDYDGPNANFPIDVNDISPAGNMMPWNMHTSNYSATRSHNDTSFDTPVGRVRMPSLPPTAYELPEDRNTTDTRRAPTLDEYRDRYREQPQQSASEIRQQIAELNSQIENEKMNSIREQARTGVEAPNIKAQIEKELQGARVQELEAAVNDVQENAEAQAESLRAEGNEEAAARALAAAARITERIEAQRTNNFKETQQLRNQSA
jgi:hypothetical protein